jgi:hypothetical protein
MNELMEKNNLDFFKKEKDLKDKSILYLSFKHCKKNLVKKLLSLSLLTIMSVAILNISSIDNTINHYTSKVTLENKGKDYTQHNLNLLSNSSSEQLLAFSRYIDRLTISNNDYGNNTIQTLLELKNEGKLTQDEFLRFEKVINYKKADFAIYLDNNRNSFLQTDNKYADKIEKFNYYYEFNQEYNLFIKSLANYNYLNLDIVNLSVEINRLKHSINNKDILFGTLQYFESEIEKK